MYGPKSQRDISPGLRKIVCVICAYNEERFIGSVVLSARQVAHTVIVVDDGSVDGTAEIAEAAGAVVVRHEHNRGKGVALNSGLARARATDAEAVVILDGDGQHMTKEIPAVAAPILNGEADVVVGSRYLGDHTSVPLVRIIGHRAFTFLTNAFSDTRATDSQSGFRAFSRRALEAIHLSSKGFSAESEMQFIIRERNLRLIEVSINGYYPDKPKRPIVVHGLVVLNGVLQLVGQYRPLFFFGVPGLVALLAGLGYGLMVVSIYGRTQNLAVGYALICVLLTILGGLMLFTGIMLHSVRGLLIELVRPHQRE